MTFHRRLAFRAYIADERAAMRAQALALPLVVDGAFDLSAIVREAVRLARRMGSGVTLAWALRMRVALRRVWANARAILASAREAARPARIPARDLLLTYRDEAGALTARTVRLTRVRRSVTGLIVEAHCSLRDAPRSFRADRVVGLADVLSGRVCPDPRAWLSRLAG